MAQLAMVLQSPTTQPKQRKAPKPLEAPQTHHRGAQSQERGVRQQPGLSARQR